MKCANWNIRDLAHIEGGQDSVLGEKEFEISTNRK